MKKLLAFVLAFTLVLSMGVVAFAAGSPVKTPTAEDFPSEIPSEIKVDPAVEDKLIPVSDMTDDQKEEVNEAVAAAVEDGYQVESVVYCEPSEGEEVTLEIELGDDQVLIIDGVVYTKADLAKLGGEIKLDKPCAVVIAKAA